MWGCSRVKSGLVIRSFVAIFAFILFEQGRAMATGKLPEIPRPIYNLFVAASELMRTLDSTSSAPARDIAQEHPDLPPEIARELYDLRQSPLAEARDNVGQRVRQLAPWLAPPEAKAPTLQSRQEPSPSAEERLYRAVDGLLTRLQGSAPQAMPARPLPPGGTNDLLATARAQIERSRALRGASTRPVETPQAASNP